MTIPMIKWLRTPIIVLSWFCLGFAVPASAQDSGEAFEITDIRLSNYGGNTFAVSWRTSRPTAANELLLGLAPDELTIVKADELDSPGLTHFVTVLASDIVHLDTIYYYKVRSDSQEAAVSSTGYDSVLTRQQQLVGPGAIVQGYVVDAGNGQPLPNVIVRSFLRMDLGGSSGETRLDSTQWYADLTDTDGKFYWSLNNYRRYNGNLIMYAAGNTWMHMEILDRDSGLAIDSVLLPFQSNSSPAALIMDAYEIGEPLEKGDVDGNGALNIFDLLDLLKVMGGKISPEPWQRQVSDIDANGKVDIFDLLELLKKLKNS